MQSQRIPRPLILVLVVLLALASASPAFADPPTRVPYPLIGGDLPASYCGFPIRFEFTGAKEYLKTFVPKEGQPLVQMVNGTDKTIATNLDTGKSVEFNISGPGKFVFFADGSMTIESYGRSSFPFAAGTALPLPGYPALFIASGHSVAQYDAAGNLVQFSTTGHIEDTCAALSN